MAFPKGPPKPSSGLFFWLVIALVSALLLLLWGWQAGMLGRTGDFLSSLISPAQYQGYSDPAHAGSDTGKPALPAAADARRQALERQTAEAEASAERAAAEKARVDAEHQAQAERQAAEKAAEKARAEQEAARRQADEAAAKAAADRKAADDAAVLQAKKDMADALQAAQHPAVQPAPANVSEAAVTKGIARYWPLAQLRKYFNLDEQARRLVITVDNLPREHVPSQMRIARGVPELLRVKKDGDGFVLDPANGQRYSRIIGFVEKLDARKIGRLYARFYPLLQHTYEETGFPDQRFHDRVLAALDDMIQAPQPTGPIRLVQPKVLYRYADEDLESLSAGQKIMIRIGAENAARLRQVLVRVRAAIAAHDPGEAEPSQP
ncbi:MAG: DUF3014 domain-containing protein [Lautropia sp.]|nr:DUF3014 domain-containing protein [Lautropia sp.]